MCVKGSGKQSRIGASAKQAGQRRREKEGKQKNERMLIGGSWALRARDLRTAEGSLGEEGGILGSEKYEERRGTKENSDGEKSNTSGR